MYNSYKEIVWLLNLLNTNDRRATFSIRDIFNGDGPEQSKLKRKMEKELYKEIKKKYANSAEIIGLL